MNQRDIDNAIRGQLGIGAPNQPRALGTPPAQVAAQIRRSTDASALNPRSNLESGGAPVGPEDFRPAR